MSGNLQKCYILKVGCPGNYRAVFKKNQMSKELRDSISLFVRKSCTATGPGCPGNLCPRKLCMGKLCTEKLCPGKGCPGSVGFVQLAAGFQFFRHGFPPPRSPPLALPLPFFFCVEPPPSISTVMGVVIVLLWSTVYPPPSPHPWISGI